jgi:hypothetical protein
MRPSTENLLTITTLTAKRLAAVRKHQSEILTIRDNYTDPD